MLSNQHITKWIDGGWDRPLKTVSLNSQSVLDLKCIISGAAGRAIQKGSTGMYLLPDESEYGSISIHAITALF